MMTTEAKKAQAFTTMAILLDQAPQIQEGFRAFVLSDDSPHLRASADDPLDRAMAIERGLALAGAIVAFVRTISPDAAERSRRQ